MRAREGSIKTPLAKRRNSFMQKISSLLKMLSIRNLVWLSQLTSLKETCYNWMCHKVTSKLKLFIFVVVVSVLLYVNIGKWKKITKSTAATG